MPQNLVLLSFQCFPCFTLFLVGLSLWAPEVILWLLEGFVLSFPWGHSQSYPMSCPIFHPSHGGQEGLFSRRIRIITGAQSQPIICAVSEGGSQFLLFAQGVAAPSHLGRTNPKMSCKGNFQIACQPQTRFYPSSQWHSGDFLSILFFLCITHSTQAFWRLQSSFSTSELNSA